MSTVKAYAIHTIMRRDPKIGKYSIPASTKQRVSVFDVSKEDFDKLHKAGAVREASKEEIAIAKVQSNESDDAPTNVETLEAAGSDTNDGKVPASGAVADPQGKPKGSTTKAPSKDEEI